ncbi:hypothetical protein BGZ94_008045, partial [Podila epigama]
HGEDTANGPSGISRDSDIEGEGPVRTLGSTSGRIDRRSATSGSTRISKRRVTQHPDISTALLKAILERVRAEVDFKRRKLELDEKALARQERAHQLQEQLRILKRKKLEEDHDPEIAKMRKENEQLRLLVERYELEEKLLVLEQERKTRQNTGEIGKVDGAPLSVTIKSSNVSIRINVP